MSVPTIRTAAAKDVEAVARFQIASWRETYVGLLPASYLDEMTLAERVGSWTPRIANAERDVALAETAGTLVGVVSTSLQADPPRAAGEVRELNTLYVAKRHQGTGLAARLLSRAIGSAPAHLWVFSGNLRAQAFYAKHGFVPNGETAIDPGTGLSEQHWVRARQRSSSQDPPACER